MIKSSKNNLKIHKILIMRRSNLRIEKMGMAFWKRILLRSRTRTFKILILAQIMTEELSFIQICVISDILISILNFNLVNN
jgi:hypothetical protein